jgi:hypothetical protein
MDGARRSIQEHGEVDVAGFRAGIVPAAEPVVLRGAVGHWPVVQAALRSPDDVAAYLARFDRGAPITAFIGPPEIRGRFFYRPDMAGFNFERRRGKLGDVIGTLIGSIGRDDAPSVYMGSTPASEILPGFAAENELPFLEPALADPRIWVGNQSVVAAHFDESDNIACVVAGRRRFTLFPPDQVANLYIGPLDFTMAGQPSSMVSLADPDFEKFPRFREALAAARTAELEPGDAIYIPTLWWHHVEAVGPFNILINHWWRDVPPEAGSAFESMVHAVLAVAALPAHQREAWRAMFDHYVFRKGGDPAAHLAPEHRGILAEPTLELRERIRQFLLRTIGRR